MGKIFHLDVISPESEIFSGAVHKVFAVGVVGGLEVLFGHAPLLTALVPGPVWVIRENEIEEGFVICGGVLEVQPKITTILASVALRDKDIDQAAAEAVKRSNEQVIAQRKTNVDYAKARSELAMAVAQLRVLKKLRKKLK